MKYPKLGSKTYLEFAMKRWLWEAGYKRCAICTTWKGGIARNKICKPCARRLSNERNALLRANRPTPPPDDLTGKAEAFYLAKVDPHYYTGLRLQNRSPLCRFFS